MVYRIISQSVRLYPTVVVTFVKIVVSYWFRVY